MERESKWYTRKKLNTKEVSIGEAEKQTKK